VPESRFDRGSADAKDTSSGVPKCPTEAMLRYRGEIVKKETFVPELSEKETKISKPKASVPKVQGSGQNDKKNTFLPMRHAEVTAPVPKPICEESDVSAESARHAYASVPKHVCLIHKKTQRL
jgi:hypothetical protein